MKPALMTMLRLAFLSFACVDLETATEGCFDQCGLGFGVDDQE